MDSPIWILDPRNAWDAALAPLYFWLMVRVAKHAWMYESKAERKRKTEELITRTRP
jgi:hypothetical protein